MSWVFGSVSERRGSMFGKSVSRRPVATGRELPSGATSAITAQIPAGAALLAGVELQRLPALALDRPGRAVVAHALPVLEALAIAVGEPQLHARPPLRAVPDAAHVVVEPRLLHANPAVGPLGGAVVAA